MSEFWEDMVISRHDQTFGSRQSFIASVAVLEKTGSHVPKFVHFGVEADIKPTGHYFGNAHNECEDEE